MSGSCLTTAIPAGQERTTVCLSSGWCVPARYGAIYRRGSVLGVETLPAMGAQGRVRADFASDFGLLIDGTIVKVHRHGKRWIRTSKSALSRFFARHGITFKKKPASRGTTTRRGRPRPPTSHGAPTPIREPGMLDPARLVFIDETAVSTNMVRLRGRAPRGTRVIGTVPLGAWENTHLRGRLAPQ